ncbi:hypothetical protein FI312_07740 [Campylobacter coli]|nr:hypothetical protein [Campylobacter coli]
MGFASYLSGILGEDKACEFLKKQKIEILKRNFRSKFGEIDIIAVGGKIKCRKRKIKCRIFATNYLSFNLKLKL